MFVYPSDALERLEYIKVIDHIREYCLSESGSLQLQHIAIETDAHVVEKLLKETEEFRNIFERGEVFPIFGFESIFYDIEWLKKDGYVLDVEAIQRIYFVISISLAVQEFVSDEEKRKFIPLLCNIVQPMELDQTLIREIDKVFDSKGEIKPDASPELLKISKQIKSKERESDKIFLQELEFFRTKGFLTDSFESIRNGRRVLTVLSEHKRKVGGIIHDESATGKSMFIEPEKLMSINIEINNLYADRKAEIYKIIRDLCIVIRPYSEQLLTAQEILTTLDVLRAKAKYAYEIKGKRPKIQKKSCLRIKVGYNPVLYVKNRNAGIPIIPFDLVLHNNNRILILSGPNAGGKSVVLKSVGLLQLLLQSGILIPVDENSEFGIFKQIFVDIGDQQSLEDDLSTYSSHLKNMKITLEKGGADSLILFDEFGAGTDPKIGGAMAEAVLYHLNKEKCFGVITTHYSNLKFFAFKAPGIVNGSMEFDKQKLVPTYQMHVGKPGSSFAFEIARKTGLPEHIIEYAQKKSGKNEQAVDEMLISLMDEKKEFEKKFDALIDKQDKLDRLIKSYEQMTADIEVKRKKMKLEAKESAAHILYSQKHELQKAIQEVKKIKDESSLKKMVEDLKEKQKIADEQLVNLKQEVYDQEVKKQSRPIEKGDFVKMRSGSSVGEVITVSNKKAEVQMGHFKLFIPVIDLELSKEPIVISNTKSINTDKINKNLPESKIDLREYTKQDAMRLLQEFLDRALLHNFYELKIIHGHGTGVMKKEVWKMLREYKDVKKYWHPESEQGGEGVTLVQF
ncbi:MAG: Smr/MutS family protein [Saprospiraceae bacterium]|nr:Smr/MutS family protein [Saprospiraceae bacterium]